MAITTPMESSLADIAERLSRIERIVEVKTPHLSAEEAISIFTGHIRRHHRCPGNFDYLLREFMVNFRGRNIVELVPKEVEGFLFSVWGGKEPSTLSKRTGQLTLFFNICIRELRNRGIHGLNNPCAFINRIRIVPKPREGFIPSDTMIELLNSFNNPAHWLMFAILMTAGLRVGELLKLRPRDVEFRVLTLIQPKSGRDKEYAVIPEVVAIKLREHIRTNSIRPDNPIFPTTRSVVGKLLRRHSGKLGLQLSPHDLRRWCSSFWERQGEIGMMRFVLRHSSVRGSSGAMLMDPLASRYVSMLSVEEAKDKQDILMTIF